MKYKTRSKKTSWQSDFNDYSFKLDDMATKWLEAFNKTYYGADIHPLQAIAGPLSSEMKTEIYARQYSQRNDAMNNCCMSIEPIIETINNLESK